MALSPTAFRRQLAALKISQLEAARRLRVDPRTVRRWALGERRIPHPVALVLECWTRHGLPAK